jgi:hypothetical protein
MNIGLLEAHNSNYQAVADLCVPSKISYCKRHGYEFVQYSFGELPDKRTPHWGRILAIQASLSRFDWLLYLDTDTVITNPLIRIEPFLDEKCNVVVGLMPAIYDGRPKHISTSAILIKNCEWVYNYLLPKWFAQKQFINNPYLPTKSRGAILDGLGGRWFEQSAYQYLYDTDDAVYSLTKVMPNCWLNSRTVTFQKDSFLNHFTLLNNGLSDKIQTIKDFLKKRLKI